MRQTLAGLEVEVLQSTKEAPRAACILCHGFGAPGDDLVPLHGELVSLQPSLADVRFYFPAAPLSLGGLGLGDARAWWMIDMNTMMKLQLGDADSLRAYRRIEPEGMAMARARVLQLVSEVLEETRLPASKLLLGGFSQGAMITTDVALRLPQAPAGLMILSGTMLIEDEWAKLAAERSGLPVFQGHGRQDPLLAFRTAEWLRELLTKAGLEVQFHPFDGGHTIDLEELREAAAFAAKCLPR